MANVYIVKSGQLVDFVGWEWLNLRAFTDYDRAVSFMDAVSKQIKPKDLGETEDVTIDTLELVE